MRPWSTSSHMASLRHLTANAPSSDRRTSYSEDEHAHLDPGNSFSRRGLKWKAFRLCFGRRWRGRRRIGKLKTPKTRRERTIAELRNLGFKHIVMLTGDSERTAARIASEAGIDEFQADLLPEDKFAYVDRIKSEGRCVAMVGDGVNDSPTLGRAPTWASPWVAAAISPRKLPTSFCPDTDLQAVVRLRTMSQGLVSRLNGSYSKVMITNSALLALGIAGIITPQTSSLFAQCFNDFVQPQQHQGLFATKESLSNTMGA